MEDTSAVQDTAELDEKTDDDVDEQNIDAEETAEERMEAGKQGKTWYPYITKNQFEKFLSRLHGKVPNEIDRDYVRAIIRTPSMIYRFLRGIEAMKLIDRDQKPTDRLHRLVDTETRSVAMGEIVRDLYGDMLDEQKDDSPMPDADITAFFRQCTGMGNDSANKMKMFFKYLMAEANLIEDDGTEASEDAPAPTSTPMPAAPTPAPKAATVPAPAPEPAAPPQSRRAAREKQDHRNSPKPSAPSSPPDNPPSERPIGGGGSSRPLSETQKAYLETVQKVVKIKIDGDWDDDMIRLAFDRLERLFDRVKRG